MWNVRVIDIEIMARYIDSLSHERKSLTENLLSVVIFNEEVVRKHTPLICTMISGIRGRILKNQRRDKWPCEYGRLLVQSAAATHRGLISFSLQWRFGTSY